MELNYPFTKKNILTISDMHLPYEHKDAMKFLTALKKKYKPDLVVSLGDMVDWHSVSFHSKHPDLASPGEELALIRQRVKLLEKLFPKMIIIGSNHGDLPLRKIKDAGLPTQFLRDYNGIYGVSDKWIFCDDLTLKDKSEVIYFAHGISKDASKVAAQRGVHHICGHYHTNFTIDYVSNPLNLLWAVNGGCLIDREALAFEYGKLTLDRPIIGTPVILKGQPRLEPMLLTEKGKWVGKLL
jgi:predicted MPP superfamily phosphohydrolase